MELNNEENDTDTERGEWKIQLVMQNNCISFKNFEYTLTIYSPSEPIEVFMGSDTNDTIDKPLDTTLKAIEIPHKKGSEFIHESFALLYYYFLKIDIKRAKSYIASPNWWRNKGPTINLKNKKDNKCFQYAITLALNYNKI